MSRQQDIFILAEQSLRNVVGQIPADSWDKLADGVYNFAAQPQTMRQLINYHVFDDLCVPDTLGGMAANEVTEKFQGDVLGNDPVLAFDSAMDAAMSAVRALDKDELDRLVHLSYGDYPIREYLVHITTFRGFRSYTLAKYLGLDTTMDPALVSGLWDEVVPNIEQWREMGVFPAEIMVADDANQQTRLLGKTGYL